LNGVLDKVPYPHICDYKTFHKYAFDKNVALKAFANWRNGKAFYEKAFIYDNRNPYVLQQGALYLSQKRKYDDAFAWIDRAISMTDDKYFSIRNSHAVILFNANIEKNDGNVREQLDKSMQILEKCINADSRKRFHARIYASQAILYYKRFNDEKAVSYLKTARSWLEKIVKSNTWDDEKKFTLLQNEVMGLPIIPTNLTFKGPLDSREKTDYIVIHHTAVLRPHTVQEVHQWHLNRKDEMYGIAYHYFIKKDGTVFEGRPRDSKGALVPCINNRAIGICLEGNFNKETIGAKQWEACVKLAALLEMQYRAKTHQHREFDNKTSSPGFHFDFEKFKSEVRKFKAQTKSILSKRLDDGGEIRQLPPMAFVPAEKYDAAADHPSKYLHLLEGKRVAVVCNPTSRVKNVHLVDFLLSKGIEVCKIFAPEHGFRGDADAGARIIDGKDPQTQLPIISIYNGNTLLPSSEDLSDVDVILFDIQDVGVRFFTYLSNLTDMMEAAAVNKKKIIVLDRPNPNGFYVDGPSMPTAASGGKNPVGRHPVPIVYGMTIGEYAMMVNGEGWLKNNMKCDLTVVWMDQYNRRAIYELPIKPSPNLPDWQSVYLYPSLCLFEGTTVSVGRGTHHPFCCFGHPQMRGSFSFTPKSMTGATNPLHKNTRCNGESLVSFANDYAIVEERLHIEWLRDAYFQLSNLPDDDACNQSFFKPYFTTLMGDTTLEDSIIADQSIEDIQFSWQREIHDFMKDIRSKYLHYL
jgi:uncharacterized protein YbbC (DUF1343 family)